MGDPVPWDAVYRTREETALSWFQTSPEPSIGLIVDVIDPSTASVVDIGAGMSRLADTLLDHGCPDLTVVDVSATALGVVERRVGADDRLTSIVADVTEWRPTRTFDLWHDRAVLHFLNGVAIDAYRECAARAVHPGGHLIVGTFSPDGPEVCSGRSVTRYADTDLFELFADRFIPISSSGQVHRTPSGTGQSFTWVTLRRRAT